MNSPPPLAPPFSQKVEQKAPKCIDAFSRQALACIYTCSPEAMSEVMSEATSEAMSEAAPLKRKGQRVHAMQSVIGISRESHLSQLPCAWYY